MFMTSCTECAGMVHGRTAVDEATKAVVEAAKAVAGGNKILDLKRLVCHSFMFKTQCKINLTFQSQKPPNFMMFVDCLLLQ